MDVELWDNELANIRATIEMGASAVHYTGGSDFSLARGFIPNMSLVGTGGGGDDENYKPIPFYPLPSPNKKMGVGLSNQLELEDNLMNQLTGGKWLPPPQLTAAGTRTSTSILKSNSGADLLPPWRDFKSWLESGALSPEIATELNSRFWKKRVGGTELGKLKNRSKKDGEKIIKRRQRWNTGQWDFERGPHPDDLDKGIGLGLTPQGTITTAVMPAKVPGSLGGYRGGRGSMGGFGGFGSAGIEDPHFAQGFIPNFQEREKFISHPKSSHISISERGFLNARPEDPFKRLPKPGLKKIQPRKPFHLDEEVFQGAPGYFGNEKKGFGFVAGGFIPNFKKYMIGERIPKGPGKGGRHVAVTNKKNEPYWVTPREAMLAGIPKNKKLGYATARNHSDVVNINKLHGDTGSGGWINTDGRYEKIPGHDGGGDYPDGRAQGFTPNFGIRFTHPGGLADEEALERHKASFAKPKEDLWRRKELQLLRKLEEAKRLGHVANIASIKKALQEHRKKRKSLAGGFIPNFYMSPIEKAITAEGIMGGKPAVGFDNRLKSISNPSGMGVYDKGTQSSLSQGIGQHLRTGDSRASLTTMGSKVQSRLSTGYVPNFCNSR